MKPLAALSIFLLLCAPMPLFADAAGTLSVFVFLDGKPLANMEILVDGKFSYKTDSDGSQKIRLTTGPHQVEVSGKDEAGQNLGYIKKTVEIKEGKDTQLIARFLSDEEDLITIDAPLDGVETRVVESSAKAFLQGTVLSSETRKPISNARVFVRGTSVDARTNKEGSFRIEVPAEVPVSISIVHSEYASQTVDDLSLPEGERVTREFELSPASVELEEFIVLAPKVKGSIARVVAEEKETVSIANFLSSEELSKKGDSTAAEALKRVVNLTLIDGKDVYVRGLGERYSNIEMNSLPLPSPDPLKRAVPLDIFPAGAIRSMKIQKSATPDIPASFGGGYIDIRTKERIEDDYIKLSVQGKGNTNTFDDVYTYEGSGTDWLGFDDGYREVDQDIRAASQVVVGERVKGLSTENYTEEQLSKFTQDFVNRDYHVVREKQPPGGALGLEGSKSFAIGDRSQFSLYGYYKYETDSTSRIEDYFNYRFNVGTGELEQDPIQFGEIHKSLTEYVHNAFLNLGYTYDQVLRLRYTLLYTKNSEDVTRIVDGILGSNNEDMTRYFLDWEERTLFVNQLSGAFDYELFGNDTHFRFGCEYAQADLYQPNNYGYTFINEPGFDGRPYLNHKLTNNLAERLESNDSVIAFFVKNKFHFDLLSNEDFLDLGVSMSSKERESRQERFFLNKVGSGFIVDDREMTGTIEEIYDTYVRAEIPYEERSLVIGQLFLPDDFYDAEVDETDVYMSLLLKPFKKVEVLTGARYVDFSQVVYQYREDRNNPDVEKRRLIQRFPEELTVNDFFPSLAVKYVLDEKNIVDFALSRTYIVPDLREFTSGAYSHPYEVATIIGNPDLVNTDIYSVDLKYGHYFSGIQNIKFGLFYKHLKDPIEDAQRQSSSLPVYTFINTDQAILYGVEIDGRRDLSFIHESMKNFFISGNFSYTKSEVTLTEEQQAIYTSDKRELQGLSPTVLNVTVGYDTKRRSITLSYNKMGERIRKVGLIDGENRFPDQYEDPAALLDFVWIENFRNGITLTTEIGNILQQKTVWRQGDRVTREFKDPMTFSLKVSYKFP
jgi:TonB-dependent receptor